jgi:SAM-dependent methyltransferase
LLKQFIKKTPIVGRVATKTYNLIRSNKEKTNVIYNRLDLSQAKPEDFNKLQILNLINYTKTSGKAYDADEYPSAYHSVNIDGQIINGQRDPIARLKNIPYDFTNKNVLDIGCNQGGMLFAISDLIKSGTGIDYDSRMINVANRLRFHNNKNNLSFYVFDLEKEDLYLILDFIPYEKIDIVFLLSMCVWLKNWRFIIKFISSVSSSLLFESNGDSSQQNEQIEQLNIYYNKVEMISEISDDDARQKNRKLFFCQI